MANLDRLHEQSELLRSDYERSVVECTAARSEQDRLYAESERLAVRMREMDVKSENLREKLRTTEAAAADAESGAAVVRTQLANNAETLLRLQREIGEQKERAGGLSRQVGEHRARIESIAAERRALADRAEELRRSEAENASGMDEQNKRLSAMLAHESELNRYAHREPHGDHASWRKTARRWKSALCRQRKSSPPRSGRTRKPGASHGREEAPE